MLYSVVSQKQRCSTGNLRIRASAIFIPCQVVKSEHFQCNGSLGFHGGSGHDIELVLLLTRLLAQDHYQDEQSEEEEEEENNC